MSLISLLVAESETNFGGVIFSTQEPKDRSIEPRASSSIFRASRSHLGPSLIQESSQTLPRMADSG